MLKYTYTRLLVRDFPAAFRFYRDTLGFATTFGAEDENYADFETGGVALALFPRGLMAAGRRDDGQPGPRRRPGPGRAHLRR